MNFCHHPKVLTTSQTSQNGAKCGWTISMPLKCIWAQNILWGPPGLKNEEWVMQENFSNIGIIYIYCLGTMCILELISQFLML